VLTKWGVRREIRKKHAAEWARAPMKAKGVMPDQLVATPGWSRANERRALTAVGKRKGPAKAVTANGSRTKPAEARNQLSRAS